MGLHPSSAICLLGDHGQSILLGLNDLLSKKDTDISCETFSGLCLPWQWFLLS